MNNKKQTDHCQAFYCLSRVLMLFFCIMISLTFYGQNNNSNVCTITDFPSVQFRSNSSKLLSSAETILTTVGNKLKNNPACKAKVIGYGDASKRGQQLSLDHVNAVIKFLVEEVGISRDRCLFSYDQSGDPNTVDLIPTQEDGPNIVPVPVPHPGSNN